jgi:hypothetical protein
MKENPGALLVSVYLPSAAVVVWVHALTTHSCTIASGTGIDPALTTFPVTLPPGGPITVKNAGEKLITDEPP